MTRAARGGAVWATGLVVAGEICMDAGAALAVLVFPTVGPVAMVMMRLVFSALVLLVLTRPRVRGYARGDWGAVIGYGTVLATMNALFYLALDRLPLGVTVTIEVLGPLVLSIVASRRASAWLWAVLAFAGVLCLGGGGWDRLDPLGAAFALGAAASWAFYILAAARVGRTFPKLDGLALAMAFGAVLSLPFGIISAGATLIRPEVLGLGAAVALLSSTIPYALELIALRRIPAPAFAILMSMSPATAAVAGFVLLGQRLVPLQLAGIALVVVAGIGAVRSGVAQAAASRPRRAGAARRVRPGVAGSAASAPPGPATGSVTVPGTMVADPTGPLAVLNGPLTGPIQTLPMTDLEEPFAEPLA